MIVNVRGCNGSGKTTISHTFFETYGPAEGIFEPNFRTKNERKAIAHRLPGNLFIAGRYQAGCDGINYGGLKELVRALAREGHVIFENVLVSGNAKGIHEYRQTMPEQQWIWAFLDTPEDVCIARVYARREEAKAAGWNHRQEKIDEPLMRSYYKRCRRSRELLLERGVPAAEMPMIDHTDAFNQVRDILWEGGWRP